MGENIVGQISVRFMSSFSENNIKVVLDRTGLEIKELSGNTCLLAVPEGDEDYWIKRFNDMDPVNIASRVRMNPVSDSRPHLVG